MDALVLTVKKMHNQRRDVEMIIAQEKHQSMLFKDKPFARYTRAARFLKDGTSGICFPYAMLH